MTIGSLLLWDKPWCNRTPHLSIISLFSPVKQKKCHLDGTEGGSRRIGGHLKEIINGGNCRLLWSPLPFPTIIIVPFVCSSLQSYCLFPANKRHIIDRGRTLPCFPLVGLRQATASHWSDRRLVPILLGFGVESNIWWFSICMHRANMI